MKKYFATLIIAVVMFSTSLTSCTKDVSGTEAANKTSTGNVSNIIKKTIITQDESTYVKSYNLIYMPQLTNTRR